MYMAIKVSAYRIYYVIIRIRKILVGKTLVNGCQFTKFTNISPQCIIALYGKGEIICAAFLDHQKAFDSLDRCILLCQLSDLRVSHAALCWFKNYLTDRSKGLPTVAKSHAYVLHEI